jgi:hypothetical protein
MVLLALVLGTVLAFRASMGNSSNNGDTDVAGAVIERSEEPSEFIETPQDDPAEPLIVRPNPDRRVAQRDPIVEQAPDPAPLPPADQTPVGLVRDPAPPVVVAPDTDGDTPPNRQPRDRDNTDVDPAPAPRPDPRPEPKPKPEPKPAPKPAPTAAPQPDTKQYELREGTGLTTDSVESYQLDETTWDWLFRSFAGHDGQVQGSRKTQARLSVGFSEAAKRSSKQERTFRCDATLTAGSKRLITDTNHVFEISLWTTTDGYNPSSKVGSGVLVRRAFDMAPGTSHTLLSNTYLLDAANDIDYICQATYLSR